MNSYLSVWKKYATFSGRARRQEYWMFGLMQLVLTAVLGLFGLMVSLKGSVAAGFIIYGLVGLLSVAAIIPSLAVAVRRLHDTGRSGWWLLVNFVPAIGGLIFFIFLVLDSQPGDNAFGENPKGIDALYMDATPA